MFIADIDMVPKIYPARLGNARLNHCACFAKRDGQGGVQIRKLFPFLIERIDIIVQIEEIPRHRVQTQDAEGELLRLFRSVCLPPYPAVRPGERKSYVAANSGC